MTGINNPASSHSSKHSDDRTSAKGTRAEGTIVEGASVEGTRAEGISVEKAGDVSHAGEVRQVLLQGVVGSTAYGLAGAGSDQDLLGCYQAPTRDVLGLRGPAVATRTIARNNPDSTLHEVGKLISLCLKTNPTAMELLWLSSYTTLTDRGQLLLEIRSAFLHTAGIRNAYGGYAFAQARRLSERHEQGKYGFSSDVRARTAKHGRHCARLLHAGTHLLRTGQLLVDVSHLREELFAAGELAASDPVAFEALFARHMDAMRAAEERSVLPDVPDVERIEQVLIELRLRDLH